MKIIELKRVPKNKIGHFNKNGVKLEPHEEVTAKYLTLYGFSIEVIKPINTPKTNNSDILMSGTIWEMKAPQKYNEQTLKKRMKKASKQADKVVFDLRNMKTKDHNMAKSCIIKLFLGNRAIRKMIVIEKNKKVLLFIK